MKKVCIAEDDSGIARLISRRLEKRGYEVTHATSGKEALNNDYSSEKNNLLLLDYLLPDYTADELITAFEERDLKIPFVVMTGQGDERIAVEMMKRGARDYIIKDSRFLEILPEIVDRVFAEIEREKRLKKTEFALELSQFKYRMMAESIQDGMMIVENNKISYINPRMTEITGYSLKEIRNVNPIDYMPAAFERERIKKIIENFNNKSIKNISIKFWITRKDSRLRFVQAKISSIQVNNIDFTFIVFSDETEEKLVENALQESESKYRMIFESSPLSIITINDSGAILSFNPASEKLLGIQKDLMLGEYIGSILPIFGNREKFDSSNICNGSSSKGVLKETLAFKADGTKIYTEISCAKWTIKNSEVFALILTDITDRKRHEIQLKSLYKTQKILFEEPNIKIALENVTRTIGETSNLDRVAVYKNTDVSEKIITTQVSSWSRTTNISDMNKPTPANVSYFDLGIEGWLNNFKDGKPVEGIPSSFPDSEESFLEKRGTKYIIGIPIIIKKKLWGFVSLENCTSKKPVTKTEKSLLSGIVNNLKIRIEREIIQNQITSSRRLLLTTLESIDEAVLVLDSDMSVRHVNTNFFVMFHGESGSASPVTIIEETVENGDNLVNLMKELSTSKKETAQTYKLVTGRYLECFTCPLESSNPKNGRLWTFRDVTGKVKQEIAKREFINSVAHELRNPLVLIQGYTEILLGKIDKESEEYSMLETIYDATQREIRQVSDFVDVGRTNPIYNFKTYESYGLFSELVKKFAIYTEKQVQHVIGNDNYKYSCSVDERLKNVYVNVDLDRIQEIVENLITNSIKYSNKFNINIRFDAEICNGNVCFHITDQGLGIPEDQISKVFKPFYQVERGNGELPPGGLGLGLSNVMLHVNSHDAKISIDSKVNSHTKVTVKLPITGHRQT
ncbi:MAG: PAS domain S-box protein [Caldisericia bacterium]